MIKKTFRSPANGTLSKRASDYSQRPLANPEATPETIELVVDPGARGERLDRFLASRLPEVSRTRIQQWIVLGAVHCEERLLTAKSRLAGHETLSVRCLPREADQSFAPDPVPLNIVHEDDSIWVIDKPAGLVVHPGSGHWRGTLMNGLLHLDARQATLPRAGIVHRLDKDTSGLLVVARTEQAQQALIAQFAGRSLKRAYLAFATGALRADEPVGGEPLSLEGAIGRDPRQRIRMALDGASARPALTLARPLRSRPASSGFAAGASAWACRLQTGRTHQIRVHLAARAHPLLGDALYGGSMERFGRQALHAASLSLLHPGDGRLRGWRSPLPEDLQVLSQALELDWQVMLAHPDFEVPDIAHHGPRSCDARR